MPPSLQAQSDSTQTLRLITILSFVPSFILLLVHGIISQIPFPALGLIPLGLSALLGVYLLYRDKVVGAGSPIQLTGQQILVADTLFSAADFIVLLLSWAAIPSDYDEGRVMLGTYSTIPLMVDCGIHAYLAIRPVRTALVYAAKHQPDVYGLMGRDNRMAYTPVSVDDEVVEVVEEGRSGGYA